MAPKFALQNVLDVHHSRVEALEVQLGKLVSMKTNTENLLENLRTEKQTLMQNLENAQVGEIDLFNISVLRSNILRGDKRIATVLTELARIEEAISKKQQELINARQEEEVLEILKRKGIETYNAEIAYQEARTQDDIYIAQAFRQRSEGV